MKKATFDREFLQSTLSKSVKFVPSKDLIPAFKNVRVTISNGLAEFVSCDGNAQLIVKCQCAGDDIQFCVDAKLFLKTVSFLSDNNVIISMKDDHKLTIKSGKSKSNISLDCAYSDFPIIQEGPVPNEININEFYLKKALKSVSKFVDDAGNNVSCINIITVDNEMVFTGRSQAQLLRIATKPISITAWNPLNIFPELSDKLCSLLGDSGEVTVSHNEEKVFVFKNSDDTSSDFSIASVTPRVKYPNVESLIKSGIGSTKILVNTAEMLSAVKRLQLYVDLGKVVSMDLNGDILNMKAVNNDRGTDCEEEISCVSKQGVHPLKKNFNVEFLIQILSEIDENEVWFIFDEDTKKPVYFIPNVSIDKNINYTFLTKELFV